MKTLAAAAMGALAALAIATEPVAAASAGPAPLSARQVQDRLAIEDLMGRYEWALDAGDARAYGALFAEDGVLASVAGEQKGRAAIVKMIEDLVKRFSAAVPASGVGTSGRRPMRIQHILSNLVVDLHGDTAEARSYWTEIWNPKGPGLEVRAAGHYEDRLVRRGGTWWFARRQIVDDIMPASPPAGG